jgi:tRNA dimethylallyltransferase
MTKYAKLLSVVGETASGKSALALQIAQRFNGEIICADSATLRRGLDIGTAKPSLAEQALVPHHLLNIIEPDEKFTVAKFKQLAEKVIADIQRRGKLPLLVGGTGLYVDAVLYDYSFGVKNAPDRQQIRPDNLTLGLKLDRAELKIRIEQRIDAMLAAGLESEVAGLVATYGWQCLGLKNVGYAQWRDYFQGIKNLAETRSSIIKATLDLAKRQRTWFKRNYSIHWLDTPVNMTEVVDTITTFLST